MNNASFAVMIAASQGFLAVALGAFGSHCLRGRVSEAMLGIWQTGVQYHFYHALALFCLALYWHRFAVPTMWKVSFWAFLVGIIMFCGSLYGMALGGPRWLGPITPMGGMCFLVGWLLLAIGAMR